MSLNEEQTAAVAGWVREGLGLPDIQKRLETEFEVRITYMDLRFLVDDLDLELADTRPKFDEPKAEEGMVPEKPDGKVSVRLDKVTRPDALVSGQVTFSDGVTAQWHLDQMGRLALNPSQPGYKPSQEDLMEFQSELREAVEKSGMF
ncbi:MAG: hypothetical protein ACP5I4_03085 [Oceanipulchritudo sp.]